MLHDQKEMSMRHAMFICIVLCLWKIIQLHSTSSVSWQTHPLNFLGLLLNLSKTQQRWHEFLLDPNISPYLKIPINENVNCVLIQPILFFNFFMTYCWTFELVAEYEKAKIVGLLAFSKCFLFLMVFILSKN